jgi:hypothetical protein
VKSTFRGILAYGEARFLLARLHVESLLDKGTKKKILSTLDGLPRGSKALDEAYDNAIERIEGQLPGNTMLAKCVLSWIIHAQRPLTTGELCHALAVEPGDSELDLANIPDVEDMVSVCAGLVTVDDESAIIRLVHYTTEEYFKDIQESWNPRAQQDIASACLTYLSKHSRTVPPQVTKILRLGLRRIPSSNMLLHTGHIIYSDFRRRCLSWPCCVSRMKLLLLLLFN